METRFQSVRVMSAFLKAAADYLMGRTDTPPSRLLPATTSVFWGLWWGILLITALIFCGQSSKFIYIDF